MEPASALDQCCAGVCVQAQHAFGMLILCLVKEVAIGAVPQAAGGGGGPSHQCGVARGAA